jgi:hypothetical protein
MANGNIPETMTVVHHTSMRLLSLLLVLLLSCTSSQGYGVSNTFVDSQLEELSRKESHQYYERGTAVEDVHNNDSKQKLEPLIVPRRG